MDESVDVPEASRSDQRPGQDGQKSVERAMAVLEHVAKYPGTVTQIADGLGLPRATVHRTLAQLEARGFLRKDVADHQYRVGGGLWSIASTYLADHPVLEAARPHVERVRSRTGVLVQLAECSGGLAVPLLSLQGDDDISNATYGHHFPLHAGAKGQVLLAHAGTEAIERYLARPLARLTDFTIVDPDELRARLTEIRRLGYGIAFGEVQAFTGSMAAPLHDRYGQVVAVLAFIARRSRLEDKRGADLLREELLLTASTISVALGYRPELMTIEPARCGAGKVLQGA